MAMHSHLTDRWTFRKKPAKIGENPVPVEPLFSLIWLLIALPFSTFLPCSLPNGITFLRQDLPCSSSSYMVTLYFENGVTLTIRTSGTEPKIKYYSEVIGSPEDK